MKLAQWAKKSGISYRTAHRLFKKGKLPVPAYQLETGTILIEIEDVVLSHSVALYARVSSHDQKEDLARQLQRLRDFAAARGWKIEKEVQEIGSGLNGNRKKLLALLKDKSISVIVVEHRDRLARFGAEMIEACLGSSKRELMIVNETEYKEDLVQDFVDVITSMCAKIYGKRSAKKRAKRALEAASLKQ